MARLVVPIPAGSYRWTGNVLERQHLMNKQNVFEIQSGLEQTWVKNRQWRILYSPDFEAAVTDVDNSMAAPNDEPYHFVWDITSFVKPGMNALKLSNLKVLPEPTTMVFRNAQIEVGAPIPNLNAVKIVPAPTGPLPRFVASGRQKLPIVVHLDSTGGIALSMSGQKFMVTTRTSLPDENGLKRPIRLLSLLPEVARFWSRDKRTDYAVWSV